MHILVRNMIDNGTRQSLVDCRRGSEVQRMVKLKLKGQPKEMRHLSLVPLSFNFISGTRQVGKTTIVKLVIHSLLNI